MRRILTALVLSLSLATTACQNPDGSTDWGGTLALGAGAALAAALLASSGNDDGHYHRRPPRHQGGHGYGYGAPSSGYGRPYHGGHRRW